MRTTVRLDPVLKAKAKQESARTGETLTSMIERGLRLVLARPQRSQRRTIIRIPVSQAVGGLRAGVNLDDSVALLDIMESASDYPRCQRLAVRLSSGFTPSC